MHIDTLDQDLGIEYSAKFVPFSKSRNAKQNPKLSDLSLNWKITIRKNGKELSTDYMQGIGYIQNPWKGFNPRTNSGVKFYKKSAETGKTYFSESDFAIGRELEKPKLADVMHCLLLDSEVLDYSTFEEWAQNFGYDADSRSAENIYMQCMDIALKLRSMLSDSTIVQLRELFQDY